MTKVLFDTYVDVRKYYFTQSMWFEEPDIVKVLFNT